MLLTDKRKAAKIIGRAWLAHRDYQIYQVRHGYSMSNVQTHYYHLIWYHIYEIVM